MSKNSIIRVQGFPITVKDDYISLTDMVKTQGGDARAADEIRNWFNNKSTLDFIGAWEAIKNPNFKVLEFQHFRDNHDKSSAIGVSQFVEMTDAIGVYTERGKTGGTYAHKDIAFEFGTWLSPVFKLYLITEFQRLKEIENNAGNIEWNVRRVLSKAQYHIQTDAVKNYKLPRLQLPLDKQFIAYAEEGDILNLALFGFTARQWREANPELAAKNQNVREYASINELAILASLEGINAEMIKANISFNERLEKLSEIAAEQLRTLERIKPENSLRKDKHGELSAPAFKKEMFPIEPPLSDFNQKLNQALNYNPKDNKKDTQE